MQVDPSKCNGCLQCVPYCTMGVIAKVPEVRLVQIDQDECVECGVCLRSEACTYGALYQPELSWPRVLRAEFSDPLVVHPSTGIGGRGTEEMKTMTLRAATAGAGREWPSSLAGPTSALAFARCRR